MTTQHALNSSIFQNYLFIISFFIILSGIIIFIVNVVAKKKIHKVVTIYKSWLIIFPLVFLFIFLGRIFCIVGITLLSLLAFREFSIATKIYQDKTTLYLTYVGIIGLGLISLVFDPKTGNPGWYGLFIVFPIYYICALIFIPILRNKVKNQLNKTSLTIMGFIYLGWMFGHLGFLVNSVNAYGYLLYLLFAVSLNDVAGFIFGKLLGKRKLLSNISPNKTLEGAMGAILFSMLLPFILRFSFPFFGTIQLLLTGLIVGVGGQLGDLAISFIKREFGIKDMGSFIPGHGGILDRIDSLIFVSPLFFHMSKWFFGLY